MSFLHAEKSGLAVALDVGSLTLKGLIYEVSDTGAVLKGYKRIAVQMSSAYTASRIVGELHNVLAGVIKEFGRIPAKTIAGFGTSLAEYYVEQWGVEPGTQQNGRARLGQKDMAEYFSRLFEQHGKEDRAMIATPAGIEINGYAISPDALSRFAGQHSLEVLGGTCRDIRFRTVVSYFSSEIGTLLADMKRMLGGVPIEFIPLASVYREALAGRLNVRDALLIDIGGTTTMLVMLKGGLLVQTVSFPLGFSHIASQEPGTKAKILSKNMATWSQCFRESLDFLYPFGPLTGETYLCGGGAHIRELRSYIESGEWLKTLSYTATPRVIVLEGKSLLADSELREFLQGPEDAGLASVVYYGMHHEAIV